MSEITYFSFLLNSYISTKKISVISAVCEGGDFLLAGEQPNFEPADENASPLDDNIGLFFK